MFRAINIEKHLGAQSGRSDMEVGPGELFDKLSISLLKSERLSAEQVREELDELEEAFAQTVRMHPKILVQCSDLLDLLKVINGFIWDLESDIRKGKEGQLGLEEVGRRALMIRNLNSIRVWTKNLITRTTGRGYLEIKKDHASVVTV
jgi:hypothetical protein